MYQLVFIYSKLCPNFAFIIAIISSVQKSVGRQLVWAELGTSASLPGVTHTSEVPCQVSQSLIQQ